MVETIFSKRLRAGSKMYFFDVRETKEGGKYLQITESRLKEDGTRRRSDIVIFEEYFEDFKKILEEIIKRNENA